MKNIARKQEQGLSNGNFVPAEVIAEKYGVSPRYILKLAAQGRIPVLRIGKKCARFDPAAVAEALESGL